MPAQTPKREDALAVARRLREAGHVACFAGGCVRDVLLGLEPKDFDVATDAPPQRVRDLFRNSQSVGAAFGVILVRHGGSQVEVATFRADGSYADGRRPTEVRFTTAEEDAKRRDFTINGLFYDPFEDRVIDYVGGQEDLKNKVLRAIGNPNERFDEDHLRLLRAVRFAARFGLTIERGTAWAIGHHADALRRISPERVAEELRLMLRPPTRALAWRMLWEYGLVHVIMRVMPGRPKGQPAVPPAFEPDKSVFLNITPGSEISFGVALAAGVLCYQWHLAGFPPDVRQMLDEKGLLREAIRAVRSTLKISNQELEELSGVLHGVTPLLSDAEPTVPQMKRFLAQPTSEGTRHLLAAMEAVGLHAERIGSLTPRLTELAAGDVAPTPLITGNDLLAARLTPGPVFKRVLDAVYDEQLEGRVQTKEQALALAMRLSQAG